MIRYVAGVFLFTLCFVDMVSAQYQIGIIPRTSPDKAVSQKVGYTQISITHGSPAVNNRIIWGDLVRYDEVWRAGANDATTIEFDSDVSIEGHELAAGKYALFIIPRANKKWTIIFNKVHKQWGAFRHDPSEDALRLDVLPRVSPIYHERLCYDIRQHGFEFGEVSMFWEHIEVSFEVGTHYLKAFKDEVMERTQAQEEYIKWVPLIQGAEHLLDLNAEYDLAKEWLSMGEEIMDGTTQWKEGLYPRDYVQGHLYWTMAKTLAKLNDFVGAVQYANQMMALDDQRFFKRKGEEERITENLQIWLKRIQGR
jgi:hypothetical protein